MGDYRGVGAVVIGGQHPGLGIVRSLGRRGIPVVVLDDQPSIAAASRYTTRFVRVDDLLDERRTVSALIDAARRYGLHQWVLFPTRDETVAAISRHRAELGDVFRVTTPGWNSVQWAWDKKKTYELARELDIPCPMTFTPSDVDELDALASRLPLAIKPAVKEEFFYATGAKAWRANTLAELRGKYARARRLLDPPHILVQEIIPGNGDTQFSYCAYYCKGQAHSVLTARRARQYPHEFGRAATYVETVAVPEIEPLAERFLKAIDYDGLVEIEFKRDPRDGQYKLLDVNARTWGFHALGFAAGVDFPYLLFADQVGERTKRVRGATGISWLRLAADFPTALLHVAKREVTVSAYLRSLGRTRIESVFSLGDPLPSLAEFLLLPWMVGQRFVWPRRSSRANDTRQIVFAPSSETSSDPS